MARPQYMTPDGHTALAEELARLGSERTRVVQGVADAAAEGDRSENAEYIYGKKRLRAIDQKMRFLKRALDAAVVVDPSVDRGDRVFFGAVVVLEDDDGAERTYRLVGEHETDAGAGRISYRSPVGRALMGRRLDDEIRVRTPGGERHYTIVDVRYE
ncbi:MAG TPA: transcription elongation factor GreB [Sandaracinaceae bacterium LLY-WYZ-13_1]|nr:transcription elongation factor GreB [Sandaracinaceae bacterium LLY-WYZ-13_1]